MEKTHTLALLAMLATTLLQCTKEIDNENPGEPVKKTAITFTVEGDTKVSCEDKLGTIYPFTWENGDRLYAYTNYGYHGYLTNSGETNKFSGELINLPESTSLIWFIHYGKDVIVDEDGSVDYDFISKQYGKLTGEKSIMNNIALYSDNFVYNPESSDYRGTLYFYDVIIKLDISGLPAITDGNYIMLSGQEYNSYQYFYDTGEGKWVRQKSEGDCKLYNPSGEYYILLFPEWHPTYSGNYDTAILTFTDKNDITYSKRFRLSGSRFATDDALGAPAIVSNYPVIHTTDVCAIYANSASSGGHITTMGFYGDALTDEGICWNTKGEPDIDDDPCTHRFSFKNSRGHFTGLMSGLDAGTTYHVRAYVTTGTGEDLKAYYGEDKTFTTLSENPVFEYVDLGLPSGICWATFNMGAKSPEEVGDMYLWADVACCNNAYTYDDPGYTEYFSTKYRSYKYAQDSDTNNPDPTKYTNPQTDSKRTLSDDDDAAYQIWGSTWFIPSLSDFEEMRNNTTREYAVINNVAGYKYRSKIAGYEDKYIFFPFNDRPKTVASWTSTNRNEGYEDYKWDAMIFDYIGWEYPWEYSRLKRYAKAPIRPVRMRPTD